MFVEALGARVVVVGKDTRFGVRNSGDVDTLRELGPRARLRGPHPGGPRGRDALVLQPGPRSSSPPATSSAAAEILGRPHRVSGTVVHGDHRGRELGYPTANLGPVSPGLVPADGVYAGWLLRPGLSPDDPDRTMPAAVSIGTNPTFDGTQRRVEAYVLDRTDLDLYGEDVALEFVERLRPPSATTRSRRWWRRWRRTSRAAARVLSSIVPS